MSLNENSTVEEVVEFLDTLQDGLVSSGSAHSIWMLVAGFLVFFMHAGFAMLEAGSVQHKNAVNIMFKNIGTISIGAIAYFTIGYGLAYGGDNAESNPTFVGVGNFALQDEPEDNSGRALFFFQFVFAATAATIVSGAVAGRINLVAYFIIALVLTGVVYPIVSHWIWSAEGFLSGFNEGYVLVDGSAGVADFAGSSVVHMTGGVSALVGAKILGPRIGRFTGDGIPPHNVALQALGVFILWFGWYGFNCGSTLLFEGAITPKVAVTTTLAPAAAVVTSIFVSRFTKGYFDIGMALNSALAGLVSITAPCSVVTDGSAIVIGIIGCIVYVLSSKLMVKLQIDDPVDAIAVHGFCGAWGTLAVAIFANETQFLEIAGYGLTPEYAGFDRGAQFAAQLVAVLSVSAWCVVTMTPLFLVLKTLGVLRVSAEDEEAGLDSSEHGGSKAFVGGKTEYVDDASEDLALKDSA